MKKRILGLLTVFLLLAAVSFTACSGKNKNEEGLWIYYLNMDMTCIDREAAGTDVKIAGLTTEDSARTLLEAMKQEPKTPDLRRAISDTTFEEQGVTVSDYEEVTVDFPDAFTQISAQENMLIRCAIVETLCQVDGISYVTFTVNGAPFEINGETVGKMSPEDIVLDPDADLNNARTDSVILYFATADGKNLVQLKRNVSYNIGTPMEKVVMKELIRGTTTDGYASTIPTGTRLIGVSVVDNVCYVNLDETFLNDENDNIQPEVVLYSIVDSLVQLEGIDKVQIAVNGDSNQTMLRECDLSLQYSANYDLVVTPDQEDDEPATEKGETPDE